MIAKLISVGATRDEARRKMIAALEDLVALGVTTNQTFLRNCLVHPAFVDGAPTTAFIESYGTELLKEVAASDPKVLAVAAILMLATGPARISYGTPSLPLRWPVRNVFAVDGVNENVEVLALGNDTLRILAGASTISMSILEVSGSRVRFECNGVVETAVAVWTGEELLFHYGGCPHRVENRGFQPVSGNDAVRDGSIRASMNGRVVAVHAAVGDVLNAGQSVFTIEAMKMEHVHTAPMRGRLVLLAAQVGQQVVASRVVAAIEPATAGSDPSQTAKLVDSL
jgi:geranyl-CoA carboxylase alpha subunit